MVNILVTGSNGQLGNEIRVLEDQFPGYRFFSTDIEELDITDIKAIDRFVNVNQIACIINAAAYTAVDRAETEPGLANLINGHAVKNLAQIARKYDGLLVHISTDYVFNGKHSSPIKEDDTPSPISAYAHSKLLGEQSVLQEKGKSVIVRTSWLYSEFGNNFVKSMMKYGRERDLLNVVFDQVGTPTYAFDLAKMILGLIPEWLKLEEPEILHYSNEGVASWFDFTKAVLEFAGISCIVCAIETKDYPLPAPRPYYSLMSKEKIRKKYGVEIPYWRDSVKICVDKLLNADSGK